MLKRCVDIAVAGLAIIVLSPIIIVIALITAVFSQGRIIYKQERIGLNGQPFMMYKFISMYPDAEKDGPALWMEGDVRQTRWGVFMRKRRFDELPQLWNILIGDMSFVGSTRPERKYYVDQILAIAPAYANLLAIKPGLVSIGIVEYGYASSVKEMVERMQYDLTYLNNPSPFKDLKLIWRAFWKVMLG